MTEGEDADRAGRDPAPAVTRSVRLLEVLADAGRPLTLTELASRVGMSLVNLSVLKNDRARAIRFSTLTAICDALDCQVGDLLVVDPA